MLKLTTIFHTLFLSLNDKCIISNVDMSVTSKYVSRTAHVPCTILSHVISLRGTFSKDVIHWLIIVSKHSPLLYWTYLSLTWKYLWLSTIILEIAFSLKSILLNTYHAGGIGFTEQNCGFFSQNSNISQVISGITKPILGMLVLIWMHFSRWFQIW